MVSHRQTIWGMLEECVDSLSEPFRASEIIGWFRRHYPEVQEQSLRAHIQGATSNASHASRGVFSERTPLITRIDRGVYVKYRRGHQASAQPSRATRAASTFSSRPLEGESGWYREANVQSLVVAHLVREGWSITSVANTASRERGIDVLAEKEGRTLGVEVKGYPGRRYADPARADEPKPSHPSAQAGVYFAQAVLAAMRLRTAQPELINVIGLPDIPRYRALVEEVRSSLVACGIDVWLVDEAGTVTTPLR